ncbi:unnamed protein product [Gongylonema pulchrum]|uniref:Uncharacterized protein n=1 Tax=Gongylonema pulchrum TaxID=637853 RepID=A0A183CV90_9BILA|nr:unnamed protein product [Gongylonema pulchrum]
MKLCADTVNYGIFKCNINFRYLFQPSEPFSSVFLKNLKSKHLQQYIEQIPAQPGITSVMIPHFSIISPIGLRSVFGKCKPINHYLYKSKHPMFPYPCITRVFSPYKAEFGRVYRKVPQQHYGTCYIFPLWDYYHKTKMALKIELPKSKPKGTYEGKVAKEQRSKFYFFPKILFLVFSTKNCEKRSSRRCNV